MKKISTIILLFVTGAVLGFALLVATQIGTSQARVDERALAAANRLFEAGRYDELARVLEQILAQGAEDSAVFYNLGNAYYAQGDLSRALENYEIAAQLAPRDKDIQHNLDLARTQAPPVSAEESPSWITNLAGLTSSWVTINEAALLLLALWFATCFLLFTSRQIDRSTTRSVLNVAVLVGLVLVLFVGASLGSRSYLDRSPPGQVDVPTVVAEYSGPDIGAGQGASPVSQMTNP